MDTNDLRVLRDRQESARDEIDRRPSRKGGTPAFAGQVYDGGSMPNTVPAWYLTHPVEFSGSDGEGASPTSSADGAKSIPVIVLGRVPSVGDVLIAEMIGGKWVAEKGGGCKVTICLGACPQALPVLGATINVLDSHGDVEATCTTDATGCCKFDICGSRTVQVLVNGDVVYQATRTLSGTVSIALGSDSGLVCCGGFAIPKVLAATDSAGSFAFVYDPNYGFPLWTGGHSVSRLSSSVTTPGNVCLVANPTNGPVRVCYQMICRAGVNPTFSVQRSWSWVYRQGTLTPIWYQDSSGFAPGQLCITAPPPICGNPLTDTSSFAANPSSMTPFTLSGTPVPAASNATPEPIGGSIAISA